ncbi:MAG: ABC transporter permease [Rhodospirillaceae bacterium]|nr:ABC transporter permease [Rhodospirillaceae bacterium]MDE0256065.1 ABC transporter permease [Rhodospirillaceae bacterium]MDE0618484.1 ABC transporter permease [Rhodospirillaceae bacterium]
MRLPAVIAKRLGYAVALLFAVLVLNFTLLYLAPGDAAETIAGEAGGASPEMLAKIRKDYGLDLPFLDQLYLYLLKVVQGDFGHSFYFDQPVTTVIFENLAPTLLLVVSSLLIAISFGTFLGVFAARRPNGLLSQIITVLALLGYALPVFWTGIMLIILLASVIPLFPTSGMDSGPLGAAGFGYVWEVLHHLALPVLTLSTIYLAFYSRLSRASMMDVLGADYIRTARAKGLNERVVVFKHALRNAVLPVVTFAGLQFGALFSGAVLVETVFSWPGLGTLAFDSILRRDTPTLLGILFFSALIVIVANLLTDLAYRLVDPRIKSAARA